MATLSDVAARVGVSKATVSRALSRPELVAPDTAERVRRVADELNFAVNRAARGLVTGAGRTGRSPHRPRSRHSAPATRPSHHHL